MTYKINPEAKALWVAALRSGKYEQGTGRLCEKNKFCCLGVAEDIFVGGWEPVSDCRDVMKSAERADTICSAKTANILGFKRKKVQDPYDEEFFIPVVTIDGKTEVLWKHNDFNRATFAQIADAIEEQL